MITHDSLTAQLAQLELRLSEKIVASERAMRTSIDNTRNLIFGTYALIIAAIFINHLWR